MRKHLWLLFALLLLTGCSSSPGPKPVEGLRESDIQSKLEAYGLVFDSTPREVKGWLTLNGKVNDPRTTANLTCEIAYYPDGSVWSVGYSVEWVDSAVAGRPVDQTAIYNLASKYLTYCASIPFTGHDPSQATTTLNNALTGADENYDCVMGTAQITVGNHPNSHFIEMDVENVDSQ